jgi:tetratricopeptide (TPR) repeat protein
MKYILYLLHIIFKTAEFLPFIGEPIRATNIDREIRELERHNDLHNARELRKQALSTISLKHQGPILRSEGEDRLYRIHDYQGALEVFEKALSVLDTSPSLYGISSPSQIYAGAARAALLMGDKEKAKQYCRKFSEIVSSFSADPKLKNSLAWHKETLNWLNTHIGLPE